MSSNADGFRYVDLFAGIGGFHAALGALGGTCVYAIENNREAATVYERNWRTPAFGDIVDDTVNVVRVPPHDVLAAGFPCQPFSKSGLQRGMDETRGTLFWNICMILQKQRPSVVLLENVRNIAGPRHTHEWEVIIRTLRELGYRVSSTPVVLSPHRLPPERGGRPQVRDRVFILGTYVGPARARAEIVPTVASPFVNGWSPADWSLDVDLPLEPTLLPAQRLALQLSAQEQEWVEAWSDFVSTLRSDGVQRLPGFPVWKDAFVHVDDLVVPVDTPRWKADFLRKNAEFYTRHQEAIERWLARWGYLEHFPPSRRKFEWQAQGASSLNETLLHLRPSGIRAKRATYAPALVAITQTTILGGERRRLSPREAARLQGLPEWFDFGDQPDASTYRQLGNGVNVGAAYYALREHVRTQAPLLQKRCPQLVASVLASPPSPDIAVEHYWDKSRPVIVRTRRFEHADAALSAG